MLPLSFCWKFNSEQLLCEAFFDVSVSVTKLPQNIDILFCLIDMKRYFKNIDTSSDTAISYEYINITTYSQQSVFLCNNILIKNSRCN